MNEKLLDTTGVGSLIVRNWTGVVDPRRMTALVKSAVAEAALPGDISLPVRFGGHDRVTVSAAGVDAEGIWMHVEFALPGESGVAVGTCGVRFNHDGDVTEVRAVGAVAPVM